MSPHNTIRQPFTSGDGAIAFRTLKQTLSTTEGVAVIREHSTPDEVTIRLSATGNTWSRAARRKKLNTPSSGTPQGATSSSVALVCQINLSHNGLEFNWVRGRDRALFDSFCNHISRKIVSNSRS